MARTLRYTLATVILRVKAAFGRQMNRRGKEGEKKMLWTIFIILLVLWALGFGVAGQALGSFVHILLAIAVVVLIVQLVTGRRAV